MAQEGISPFLGVPDGEGCEMAGTSLVDIGVRPEQSRI